jgi:hypothetical protein
MYHPLTARELAAARIGKLTVQAARYRLAALARRRPGRRPAAGAAAGPHCPGISAVRADALFVSALQRGEQPSAGQVRQAVAAAVRTFGPRGCAGRVAQEFGDHPETAAARMRWARRLTGEAFSGAAPEPACTPVPARYPAALPA